VSILPIIVGALGSVLVDLPSSLILKELCLLLLFCLYCFTVSSTEEDQVTTESGIFFCIIHISVTYL